MAKSLLTRFTGSTQGAAVIARMQPTNLLSKNACVSLTTVNDLQTAAEIHTLASLTAGPKPA